MENFENKESVLQTRIEALATQEEMQPEDILADMMVFAELSETNEDAEAYFQDLSEQLGITARELLTYARALKEEDNE